MALTARISPHSNEIIQELVAKTGKSKIEILEEALECYRFKERMRVLEEEYARLRADQKAWEQEIRERNELEGTLLDGLEEY